MPERDLIAAITSRLGPTGGSEGRVLLGPGDDAAIVRGTGLQVVSTDTTVDGVHLRLDRPGWSWADAGHRALATALSDVAAMGAEAGEAYVALTLPPGCTREQVLALSDAMDALARRTGTTTAGGDVTDGPVLVVTATVVGHVADACAVLRRDAARPGDRVGVTGALGGAAAGLALLEGAVAADVVAAEVADGLRARHLRPEPRLQAGAALVAAGVRAALDLSDGLAVDAGHLARASGCEVRVDLGLLPLQDGVAEVAAALGVDVAALAAGGGEDYELLLCAPAALGDLPGVTWIGEVQAGEPRATLRRDGAAVDVTGYEHGAAAR